MKERKDRVDHALHATHAAVEEGVVAGGGVPLARASLVLSKLKADNDDQRFGIEIVRKAVQTPLRQIAENAGEDGVVISAKILDRDEYNWGFDAQSGEFKDLVKAGIVDPTKVVRTALQDAASIAGLLVTTEAMVTERPEKKEPAMLPGGGGMGDMGYLAKSGAREVLRYANSGLQSAECRRQLAPAGDDIDTQPTGLNSARSLRPSKDGKRRYGRRKPGLSPAPPRHTAAWHADSACETGIRKAVRARSVFRLTRQVSHVCR